MEAHFLSHAVTGKREFSSDAWYNRVGDCIIQKVANEAVVADRIDELLTLYRSAIDRRVIGYQIKGVLALIKKFGWDGLVVECSSDNKKKTVEQISIASLLLVAFGDGPNSVERRSAYAQSVHDAAAASIPQDQLVPA